MCCRCILSGIIGKKFQIHLLCIFTIQPQYWGNKGGFPGYSGVLWHFPWCLLWTLDQEMEILPWWYFVGISLMTLIAALCCTNTKWGWGVSFSVIISYFEGLFVNIRTIPKKQRITIKHEISEHSQMTTENKIFLATTDRVPTVLAVSRRAKEGKSKGK